MLRGVIRPDPPPTTKDESLMPNDSRYGWLVGVLGVSMVVCCGLPVLLGAGIAVGAAGLALGSGLVVVAGALLGVWGWRRHRAARDCELPPRAADERRPAEPDPLR